MGTIAGGTLLLLYLIGLTNAANTIPEIHNIVEHLREDIPIGGYAFTINATDREGDKLSYSINGINAYLFNVNRTTGVVIVKSALDRETQTVIKLRVEVADSVYVASRDLTIVLSDANDNKPVFEHSSYNVDVPENTAVGTTLFNVSATDADIGLAAVVKYNIDEVIPRDGQSLFSITKATGEIKLNGRLNYTFLSTFYRLKINASDSSEDEEIQSSVIFAFITIVDVPDLDPRFLGLPYRDEVEEVTPVGTPVLTVTAIDQDTGINDQINYSIERSTTANPFNISANTGVIYVASEIDREVIGDTIILTVMATEEKLNIYGQKANATADVQISIIDINDNKPLFYICGNSCLPESNFTGDIFEHSAGSVLINMTVKDFDKEAQIQLIVEGADKNVFTVMPSFAISESTVQLVVQNPQELDFEKKEEMVVQVVAIDRIDTTLHSTATVTIKIKDTNDNSPKFQKDTYELQVPEHSPAGKIVANITANDPDTMDVGMLTYRLLPDSILTYFDVELHTGSVYVKNRSLIDREVSSLYSATLQAKDTDNKTGSTVLEIRLTDINDQPPVINRDTYVVFVEEGDPLQLQIQATDADDAQTENSVVVFGISPSQYSHNFTIDANTGVLRNNGTLDREALDPELKGEIELNVTATDNGTPALHTTAKVIINVEDINDNVPKFKEASYEFSVKEGGKGAFVGSVQAEDLDQTVDYSRISFRIIDGSFGSFIIRTFPDDPGYKGNITVDPDIELDYETAPNNFTLRVEAADLEQNKDVVTVKIRVLDVNDERPEFRPAGPLTVKENSTVSGAVGRFTAVDRDGNHSLVYEPESSECRCNGTFKPCDWLLLNPDGEITVNSEETLDYEQCDQVVIRAQVVDEYTERGGNHSVTSGVMLINIEDINDNAPQFIASDSVYVVVSESASKGTSVAGVTAMDRDSGINKQIQFKVTEVQFQDIDSQTSNMRTIFEAVTTQQKDYYVGIIQTVEELDAGLKGKYLVTVSATDTGSLTTITILEIFSVDKSFRIELRFASSMEEVTKNLNGIIMALTAATKAAVEVVALRPDAAESRAPGDTLMEAYFVYSNGTAIASNAVEKMLSDPEHFIVLGQFGLTYIGTVAVDDPDPADPVRYILLGLVGALIIVLAVLATSLVCTRRNYRTKLKAAKAMKSVAMVATENQKSGPVVPGTNKYTMEGANPVLNLNIDTATDLGFDEENSNVDTVSVNSLDYDMILPFEKDRSMMIIQEEDEESGEPVYVEPLGAALAQRALKKDAVSYRIGISNPAFSTTDL